MIKEYNTRAEWIDARNNYITSTEIPALFGVYKYGQTPFGLYTEKAGLILPTNEMDGERQRWGKALQKVIAEESTKVHGWQLTQAKNEYALYCKQDYGIASSFDYVVNDKGKDVLLEIKNVDSLIFAQQWEADEHGHYEAPLHIELQLQHQLLCCGYDEVKLCALVGGNRLVTLARNPSKKLQDLIIEKVGAFWDMVAKEKPPELSETGEDLEHIKHLYRALGSNVVSASQSAEATAAKMRIATDKMKEAKKEVDGLKSKLLDECKDARKLLGANWTLSRTEVAQKEITYVRKAYTTNRVTWKK